MKNIYTGFTLILKFIIIITGLPNLQAQNKNTATPYFYPKAKNLQSLTIEQTFSQNASIIPFDNAEKIYAMALKAEIQLMNKASLVRVILVDDQAMEHMVYEMYPLISGNNNTGSFSITNIAEETCMLNGVVPASLHIQIIQSTIKIKELAISYTAPEYDKNEFHSLRQNILDTQNDSKIELINAHNRLLGIDWIAGKTDHSHLPYSQKKLLVNGNYTLNLQGFEYYKGGVFIYDMGEGDSESDKTQQATDDAALRALPDRWDWRERHGANRVGSPYYDGDANKGGWFTSIQSQSCNHCWAFAPTATIEVLTNLYFNQHLNLNLSEQHIAACGGGASGKCEGGNSSASINYIVSSGVVSETCLPYKASDNISCSSVCSNPTDKIKASSRISIGNNPTEAVMKKHIIDYGPVSSGVQGMWHFMCLGGFYKDNSGGNVWIFKNSYGVNSGDKGFAYIKITGSGKTNYLYGNFALRTPLTSSTSYSVACNDKDGDGYYYWGIGTKPSTCPVNSSNEADGDDSDPCTGPLDASYVGISLKPSITSKLEDQTVMAGTTATFNIKVSGGNFLSYQWSKDGINIPGATNPTLILNQVSKNEAGAYVCKVKSRCDSISSNPAALKVDVSTGIYDLVKEYTRMHVFPNPSNGITTISYSLPEKTALRLSILNVLGEETMVLIDLKKVFESGSHAVNIDTRNLRPGVYFCKLSFSNYSFLKTMIVSGAGD